MVFVQLYLAARFCLVCQHLHVGVCVSLVLLFWELLCHASRHLVVEVLHLLLLPVYFVLKVSKVVYFLVHWFESFCFDLRCTFFEYILSLWKSHRRAECSSQWWYFLETNFCALLIIEFLLNAIKFRIGMHLVISFIFQRNQDALSSFEEFIHLLIHLSFTLSIFLLVSIVLTVYWISMNQSVYFTFLWFENLTVCIERFD